MSIEQSVDDNAEDTLLAIAGINWEKIDPPHWSSRECWCLEYDGITYYVYWDDKRNAWTQGVDSFRMCIGKPIYGTEEELKTIVAQQAIDNEWRLTWWSYKEDES